MKNLRTTHWLVLLVAFAFLVEPAFAADLSEGESGPAWLRFVGRTHPMLVHFPIALVVVAAALEAWHLLQKRDGASPTAFVCIRLGALSAFAAALTGWTHADNETFGRAVESAIFWHRWLGVAALVFASLAALGSFAAARGLSARLYRVSLFVAFGCVSGAGHLGGDLVYGEDYLFGVFSESAPVARVTEPDSMYSTEVQPILEANCYSCHGAEKQKGRLRLDSKAEVFKDDRATWLVIPGNAAESELYKRVILPPDDFDIMPAEGDPLSEEETRVLRTWIDSGAEWPE